MAADSPPPPPPAPCDPSSLVAGIRADAWGKCFSLSSLIPLIGPSLSGARWANCSIFNPTLCGARTTDSVQDDISKVLAETEQLKDNWRAQVTSLLTQSIEAVENSFATLDAKIAISVQQATEPLRQDMTLLWVNLAFLSLLVGLIVFNYK